MSPSPHAAAQATHTLAPASCDTALCHQLSAVGIHAQFGPYSALLFLAVLAVLATACYVAVAVVGGRRAMRRYEAEAAAEDLGTAPVMAEEHRYR